MELLYIMKMVLPALLVLVVIILIVGTGWHTHTRQRQEQLARETATRLYGFGRPRYKPQRTFMLTMRTIIEKCKDQRRKDEYQFAVLFFVQQDIKKLNNIHVDSNYELRNNYYNSHPLCNYEKTFWPDPENFYNYIVSRHENPKHAEEIILDQFVRLWDKYLDTKRGKKPSYVILYSWLMLCSGCTRKLLGLMRDDYKPTKFVVVYTIPAWHGESEEIAERSRNELLSAGIEIYCVKYDKFLPPGEQPGDSDQAAIDIESELEFPPLLHKN